MTQIDQIIADALAGSPETHVAILAREVARLREAPAVVVPELTEDDERRARRDWQHNPQIGTIRFGYDLATSRARAIPADRVLGEGMVAVLESDIEAAIKVVDAVVQHIWDTTGPEDVSGTALHLAFKPIKDALRANQGADHD